LLSFGIPEEDINRSVSFNFFKGKPEESKTEKKERTVSIPTTEIPLPHGSVLVSSGDSPWCEIAENYLKSRALSSKDFNFYVTDETSYVGRLLIPYYFREKIVYWQGRSMDDEVISPRYKNPAVDKDNIFFNMDELYRYTDEPLIVTEGPLDAVSVGRNAIALTGSTLSDFRLAELRKIARRRRVIFVLDKNSNGKKLGLQILSESEEHMFYVTTFPANIEDSNDALQKLGRLWIVSHLTSTACKGFAGKVMIELNCSKG
jgi:5S rRNA maturation endonuclease (ribonuclease M5)